MLVGNKINRFIVASVGFLSGFIIFLLCLFGGGTANVFGLFLIAACTGAFFSLCAFFSLKDRRKEQTKIWQEKIKELSASSAVMCHGAAVFGIYTVWILLTEKSLEMYMDDPLPGGKRAVVLLNDISNISITEGKLLITVLNDTYRFAVSNPELWQEQIVKQKARGFL